MYDLKNIYVRLCTSNDYTDFENKKDFMSMISTLAHPLFVGYGKIIYSAEVSLKNSVLDKLIFNAELAIMENQKDDMHYIENYISRHHDDIYVFDKNKKIYRRVVLMRRLNTQDTTPTTEQESLTEMRRVTIKKADVVIAIGGNVETNGVLEEIEIAKEINKPLFLLGGFGGVVNEYVANIGQRDLIKLAENTDVFVEQYENLINSKNIAFIRDVIFRCLNKLKIKKIAYKK